MTDQPTLFLAETAEPSSDTTGFYAGVALEQAIDRTLDYSVPVRLRSTLKVGQMVRVPLGRRNKPATGYVVSVHEKTDYPKIKPLIAISDDRVLVPPQLMELARWMSRYYVTPLGVVLESVIPSAVKKRIGLAYSTIIRLSQSIEETQSILEKTRAVKRRAILARLLQVPAGEGIELIRLAGEAGVTPATVRKLLRLGLITQSREVDLPRTTAVETTPNILEHDIKLNEQQQLVFDELLPKLEGGFTLSLLLGVTGSGKTEVYLQCIRKVIEQGKQAIVLVPEIALTPQTVRRFTARFPRVAILHSGLTSGERHRHWQRIASAEADVVVGARSAVFAPVPKLGIIVVDEEHEASYKQDTAPRYQGRDVAVKRAQLAGVPILLGSATPSLEMFHRCTVKRTEDSGLRTEGNANANAQPALSSIQSSVLNPQSRQQYTLLTLASRVRGLQMPHVELIDMRQENKFRRGIHLLGQRLEHLLQTTIESKRQAILLLNRRGYSNFVYCAGCGEVVQCKYCDTTMTYHRSSGAEAKNATLAEGLHTGQLHCHYCLAVNTLPPACPTCGKKLSLFGLGTQRVEEELTKKFPNLVFARVDSDSMRSASDYEALLAKFSRGEIQVLLGTQMIAKGLDYPNVTLVGVISGDTALSLPDFRAAERTFQLITQVAGRAGRGDAPGRVVLQTFQPDDPTIQAAIKQDFLRFAKTELQHRRSTNLPPFSRMARIILRDQDEEKLHALSEDVAAAIASAVNEAATAGAVVAVKGPMPCAISRIAGYYRNQIVLSATTAGPLQRVLATVRKAKALAKSDRIAVDVDPVSLL